MPSKTTTRLAAFALLSLAGIQPAFADVPNPVDCTGMKAGASCTTTDFDTGICVEQNGSLACEAVCDPPTTGSPCCDVSGGSCCGTNANNGVCVSVQGGVACDTTNSQVCIGKAAGASCKTGAGEAGSCKMTGDSLCSFLLCTPTSGSSGTSGSSTSGTSGSSTSGTSGSSTSGTTGGTAGGTSGGSKGSSSGGGCSIDGLPARAPFGMGLLVAALGATAVGRRRGSWSGRRSK